MDKAIIAEFWSQVKQGAPDECWEWQGRRNDDGYGQIRLGNTYRAHRIAYKLAYGSIPDSLWVLHRCDNPPCCNPAHLFLGTVLDNNRDAAAKGRRAAPTNGFLAAARAANTKRTQQAKAAVKPMQTREPHNQQSIAGRSQKSSMSAAAVRELRKAYANGEGTTRQLATRFGISPGYAANIIAGRRKDHIGD